MSILEYGRQKRRGLIVIVALAVLTAIEFGVALGLESGRLAPLAVIAIIKALLIIDYFMHIRNLWAAEE